MTFTDPHRDHLLAHAVDLDVAAEAGCYSASTAADLPAELASWGWTLPGIVFTATGPDGRTSHQLRPDTPVNLDGESDPAKYLFPKSARPVLAIHPRHRRLLDTGASTVLVVEGTKQTLAAVSAAADDVLVVGIAGCYGWSSDGVPLPEWASIPLDGAEVVVAFDADVASNRQVHDAASRLADHLEVLGAARVRFARLPAGSKAGLDDYLATVPPARRGSVLDQLIAKATKLPRRPAAKRSTTTPTCLADEFFDHGGLRVEALLAAVRDRGHFALGPDGSVWTYVDGVYVDDPHALVSITAGLLGDRWREMHHRNVVTLLAAALRAEGLELGDWPIDRLVNVTNGMLDPITGDLHPHDPKHLSYAQLPVVWDPDATCPKFDAWLAERCGTQADDLLESAGLMLTPRAGQRRVLFLFGPSRSGKGTFLRILVAIAGPYTSGVTLHQLSTNRFAAAQLYGKVLNVAGDLSDAHLDDLSVFKAITGDDDIGAERKFRDGFTFRNRALVVFSANNPPTVSEASNAYVNRIRPFLFPISFAGAEDQRVENELFSELPGILVRLVEGVQRWHARGGYAPGNPLVADAFAQQSDVARLFAAQVLEPDPEGFVTVAEAFEAYNEWSLANRRHALGKHRFCARLDSVLGARKRRDRTGPFGWRGWAVVPESDRADASIFEMAAEGLFTDPERAGIATFAPTSPHESCVSKEGAVTHNPREGEIGPNPAIPARPSADTSEPVETGTDAWTEVEF